MTPKEVLAAWDTARLTNETVEALQVMDGVRADSRAWTAALAANGRAWEALWRALWSVSTPHYVPSMNSIGNGE